MIPQPKGKTYTLRQWRDNLKPQNSQNRVNIWYFVPSETLCCQNTANIVKINTPQPIKMTIGSYFYRNSYVPGHNFWDILSISWRKKLNQQLARSTFSWMIMQWVSCYRKTMNGHSANLSWESGTKRLGTQFLRHFANLAWFRQIFITMEASCWFEVNVFWESNTWQSNFK